jgi:hypothetical protein
MTRWGELDLTEQLIKQATEDEHAEPEEWEVIQLPAILPSGNSLWPAFWPREEMNGPRPRCRSPSGWRNISNRRPATRVPSSSEWWQDLTSITLASGLLGTGDSTQRSSGVKHRVVELRADSIGKLDRAVRREEGEPHSEEA